MKMPSNYFMALTLPVTTWFASIQQRSLTSLRHRDSSGVQAAQAGSGL